jgi:hypothetical protein
MDNSNKKLSESIEEPVKKTRGRKKKIIAENNIENVDLETLQIEQVKKKRGRKKKWEVETTTKLIQNGPISFSENNCKEEIKQIHDNYESENILFGTLNIKVHSNKDTVQVDDIKQSLKNKKGNICKINLTSSDYEDSDDEINNNLNSSSNKIKITNNKKKIPEKNMKIMKFFKDEFDIGNEILISPFRCYHCHYKFNNKPFFLPVEYYEKLNRFKVTGNFCSPNCVKSYALNSKIFQSKAYLVGYMYKKLFGFGYNIKPAPPIQTLKEYGGKLSIEEYRANFDNSKQYSVKNIFCKVVMDEVVER